MVDERQGMAKAEQLTVSWFSWSFCVLWNGPKFLSKQIQVVSHYTVRVIPRVLFSIDCNQLYGCIRRRRCEAELFVLLQLIPRRLALGQSSIFRLLVQAIHPMATWLSLRYWDNEFVRAIARFLFLFSSIAIILIIALMHGICSNLSQPPWRL